MYKNNEVVAFIISFHIKVGVVAGRLPVRNLVKGDLLGALSICLPPPFWAQANFAEEG